ncbi:Protein fam43a [Branchiostoma belcheri]|nr:Protein fam43a [Branchiostoma belcheri]
MRVRAQQFRKCIQALSESGDAERQFHFSIPGRTATLIPYAMLVVNAVDESGVLVHRYGSRTGYPALHSAAAKITPYKTDSPGSSSGFWILPASSLQREEVKVADNFSPPDPSGGDLFPRLAGRVGAGKCRRFASQTRVPAQGRHVRLVLPYECRDGKWKGESPALRTLERQTSSPVVPRPHDMFKRKHKARFSDLYDTMPEETLPYSRTGSLKRVLKSSLRRKRRELDISQEDPTYSCVYLGNAATLHAKGEGSTDQAVKTIWTKSNKGKSGSRMKLSIGNQGITLTYADKDNTKGGQLYMLHRITYCVADKNVPRIFAWIYRHEVKLKAVMLRCHAVYVKKEETAKAMALLLSNHLWSGVGRRLSSAASPRTTPRTRTKSRRR